MRKFFVLGAVALILGIQLYRPARTNPLTQPEHELQGALTPSVGVQAVLTRSCGDCHSNRTAWPWYSNVAPVSWFLAAHVREGREHLNFSDWPGNHKPKKLLDEICEEVEKGVMPLPSYLWLHSEARLSEADKRLICGWARSNTAQPK